jgi:hypothetical protein
MSTMRVFRQDDFTGGLNLRADQFQLAPNESPRMLNVEIDPRGGVFSRGAMRRINTSPVTGAWRPKNLVPFYTTSSSFVMLSTGFASAVNGDVHYSTGSNFSPLSIPVSEQHGASFAPWGETLYIATGVDTVAYKWDGTTKTALTASGPTWQVSYTGGLSGVHFPKAKHAITHAGKIFVANTKEDSVAFPNRIRWSHPNSPGNWSDVDYIDINDGGSAITGLAVYAGHLLVFKRDAVFAVFGYDSDTFQVVEISRTVGAATPHAITTTERGVYFFSYPEGLMYYDGKSLRDIFEPIRPAIINSDINANIATQVFVNNINRRIWVSVPYSQTAEETVATASFIFDPTIGNGAWLMFSTADNRGLNGGCDFIEQSAGAIMHLGVHASQPYVLAVDGYTNAYDNITGTDYQFTARYRTRWIDGGSYSQKKMFRRPEVVIKQQGVAGGLIVKAYGDYEEADSTEIKEYTLTIPSSNSGMVWGTSLWNVANWGASNLGSQLITGRSIGLAKSIQLEFTGPVGIPWGINSFTLKYNPRRVTA